MSKLFNFIKEKRKNIIIVLILLVCSIAIAIGVYSQITNQGKKHTENEQIEENYEDLKNSFQEIFTNSINIEATAKLDVNYDELVYTKYDIKEDKNGKYSVEAKIPAFKEESKVLKQVNKEIYNLFGKEILKIANNSKDFTIFNLKYVAYVNDNIVSLVILCTYKNGSNAQRRIIQTYNYNIDEDKLLSIDDIIQYKKLDKEKVQERINTEIEKANSVVKTISSQGYNVYLRNEESEIYKIENTANFFIGKNNYLYIVYAYGNNEYTSEIDLVIF